MSEDEKKTPVAKKVSVRLDDEVLTVIQSLADEYHVSQSLVIRLAIDQGLTRYLGRVRVVEGEQAEIINRNMIKIGNLLADLRRHIRMMSVNVNQIAKARNILAKRLDYKGLDYLMKNQTTITPGDIDRLIDKMEEVIKEVGNWDVFKDISM